MTWAQQLEDASFREVTFACQTLDDEYGPRRLARHVYLGRDGADWEDLGRDPRTTKLRAVFLGTGYLTELGALMREIATGEAGRFVHPLFGSWEARVKAAPVHHEMGARDMATVELEIVEDGTNQQLGDLISTEALEQQVEVDAEAVEAEVVAEAGIAAYVADAIASARSFAARARSAVEKISNMVNAVRNKIDQAIAAVRSLTDVGSWNIVRGLKRLAFSATKLARRLRDLKPSVILKTLAAATTLNALTHSLYGGTARAAEITRMNPIRNTFLIPIGTQLKVYSR
jgi:prophage DNA circulation protein